MPPKNIIPPPPKPPPYGPIIIGGGGAATVSTASCRRLGDRSALRDRGGGSCLTATQVSPCACMPRPHSNGQTRPFCHCRAVIAASDGASRSSFTRAARLKRRNPSRVAPFHWPSALLGPQPTR